MTEEEWRSIFRRNLRRKLRQRGWSQADLAKETDLSEVTISRYIHGERTPNSFVVLKIAIALRCSINDLILPNG